ncbi:MAG TPA: TetR/AcrR family transcriptional regulator [Nitrolancea sp.]|nr:TetR/AcrR family transcriptional regulator [Nitrolancea sp.]
MNAARSGRARVLCEAREFFLKRGYAEVSMQQIAEAAGMTKAALYYHFRDKDDLFGQVIIEEMTKQRRSVEQLINSTSDKIDILLDRLARLYFKQLSPDVMRMMVDYQQHVPEVRHDDIHRELEGFIQVFNNLFERAARAGEIGNIPPRIAASIFFHTLLGLIHQSFDPANNIPLDPDYAARLVTSVVLHGIVAPVPPETSLNGLSNHDAEPLATVVD